MADQKKINQKIQEILDASNKGKYIFRGENKTHPKVSSNLYRQYSGQVKDRETAPVNGKHFPILRLEKTTVDRARHHLRLDAPNIEVLTELQHQGGKTALIDFTRNIYIALFFSCNGSFDEDGRIILFSTSGIIEQTGVDYSTKSDYTIVSPTGKSPRVVFQSSVFVHAARGYIKKDKYETIKIAKELKKEFLDYLRKHFDIKTKTIYNDIQGFIENQKNYPTAEIEFHHGVACHDKNLFSKAIEHYSEAIKSNPQLPEAYHNRAHAKAALGRPKKAIKDFDKAIELRPQFVEAYNDRGSTKIGLGEYKEAIKDFNQYIELNPKAAEAYYNRGLAKHRLGDPEEAIKDFDQAVELRCKHAETYISRGSAKVSLGHLEEAIKDFNKAIELNPEHAGAYYNRGLAKHRLGDPEEAIKDFDQAIELRPQHAETYINRGSMKAILGHWEEAIRDFDKAIELKPQYAGAYYNRGNAKTHLGHLGEAKKDFDKARKLNPDEYS